MLTQAQLKTAEEMALKAEGSALAFRLAAHIVCSRTRIGQTPEQIAAHLMSKVPLEQNFARELRETPEMHADILD